MSRRGIWLPDQLVDGMTKGNGARPIEAVNLDYRPMTEIFERCIGDLSVGKPSEFVETLSNRLAQHPAGASKTTANRRITPLASSAYKGGMCM